MVCGEELGEVVVVDVVADAVALKVVCTCLVLLALDEVSVFSSAKSWIFDIYLDYEALFSRFSVLMNQNFFRVFKTHLRVFGRGGSVAVVVVTVVVGIGRGGSVKHFCF